MKQIIDILPQPKNPDLLAAKVYFHVMLSPGVIERLKLTAHHRGYKPGEFLELMLDNVLPRKIRTRKARNIKASIKLVKRAEC